MKNVSMKINSNALALLKNKMKSNNQIILLALNDGSNKYSKLGGTCTIGADFQFVILDKKDPEYNIPIENNAGLKIFTAKPEMVFLEDNLVISARNATLSLSDNSGLIDGAVSVNYEAATITKKDFANSGNC